MPVRFECFQCGQDISSFMRVGETAECSTCGSRVQVPPSAAQHEEATDGPLRRAVGTAPTIAEERPGVSSPDAEVVTVRRILPGTILQLSLIGHVCFCIPAFLLVGLGAALGFEGWAVTLNDEPVTGVMAVPVALLLGLGAGLGVGLANGIVGCIGLWLYSRFRGMTVRYERTWHGA